MLDACRNFIKYIIRETGLRWDWSSYESTDAIEKFARGVGIWDDGKTPQASGSLP